MRFPIACDATFLSATMGLIGDALLFAGAVAVQLLMLVQSGFTYLLLLRRNRQTSCPPGLYPLDLTALEKNNVLSVIVPAYNEAASIVATLRAVADAATDPVSRQPRHAQSRSLNPQRHSPTQPISSDRSS